MSSDSIVTSRDSIVTSRRRVEIQSTSEMSPYFTMTKCNKLFITYLTRSTERLPSLPSSISTISTIVGQINENMGTSWIKAPNFLCCFYKQ